MQCHVIDVIDDIDNVDDIDNIDNIDNLDMGGVKEGVLFKTEETTYQAIFL